MTQHEVELKIEQEIPIGKKDVVIPVKADGKPLGRLRISRGGVDWMPSPNSKKHYAMTWSKFAQAMEAHGTTKP
jgi:hypothetical protein